MTPQEKLAQQIQVLEALAAADNELKRMETQLVEGQSVIDSLRRELGFLDEKLAADRSSLEEIMRTANELTAEARQTAAQIEKSRDKLGRARNERENIAAEREIEELRRLHRDREDEVAKLNGLAEAARKSINELQAKRDKIQQELSSFEGSNSSSLAEVRASREQSLNGRAELVKKLPSLLIRRYDAALRRKGSGLAKAINGTCQSCRVSLPPQFFQKLMRREAFDECPNCHRILYWAPAPPAPTGAP